MLKTQWLYSEEIEAKRILHTAHQIANGFYRLNGFTVVPSEFPGDTSSLVLFPDLSYLRIHNFWERAKNVSVESIPVVVPEDLLLEFQRLLDKHSQPEPNYIDIQKLWENAEESFFKALYSEIPSLADVVTKVIIYPTNNGTLVSFNIVDSFPCEIHLHLRDDSDIYTIASAIVLSLTRRKVFTQYKGLWSESQLLVDWLIEESPIHQALSKFQPKRTSPISMSVTRDYFDKNASKVSDDFYTKLGVQRNKCIFETKNNAITGDNKILRELSTNEYKLMQLLIENRGSVVDSNALGDTLFANDNEFSLYAISKNIERLRKKLEFNGVTGSYIRTVRGEGYTLR